MAQLGRVGIWSLYSAWEDDKASEAMAELDRLGYGALWIGGLAPDLKLPEGLLAASSRIVVASGVVNVWAVDAPDLAAAFHRIAAAHPGRFLLGLGASHEANVNRLGRTYVRPLSFLADYLDALDAAAEPVPLADRVLAALGPKMLDLAARRSAGAHPFLVTPEHTRRARQILGDGPLLAPEQKVVLSADPATARAVGRKTLQHYLGRPNYVRNVLTLGFDDNDVAGGGSDRLVDALVAWGTVEQVARRITEHHEAGADHVSVQVLDVHTDVPAARGPNAGAGRPSGRLPLQAWRDLAEALALS